MIKQIRSVLGVIGLAGMLVATGCVRGSVPVYTPSSSNVTETNGSVVTTPVDQTSAQDPISATATQPSLEPYSSPPNGRAITLVNDDGTGIVVFGMTVDQFYELAAVLQWKCDPASLPDSDGPITTDKVMFMFGSDGLLKFSVFGSGVQTARGLVVGDSLQQMQSLYGTNYSVDTNQTEDGEIFDTYTYQLNKNIELSVDINRAHKKVDQWSEAG